MIEGGCRCGACRYTLDVAGLPAVYACHCTDCQRLTGSAFVLMAVVPEAAIAVTGPVIDGVLAMPSGSTSHQRLCGECHSRLWSVNAARPGMATVRAGTLDRAREVVPALHIWTASKQGWLLLDERVPSHPAFPPLPEFVAALQAGTRNTA